MAILWNSWGPSGSLNGIGDATYIHYNGHHAADPDTVSDDRAVLTTMTDGSPAIRLTHFEGDATVVSGHRAELQYSSFSQIADWGAGSVNAATRKYRYRYQMPDSDYSALTGAGQFLIAWQLHQSPDDPPAADTAGLNPALSCQLRVDAYGRRRWALVQCWDDDPTTTVQDPTKHTVELASWPFVPMAIEDIMVDVVWSYTTAGYLVVYRNFRPVVVRPAAPNRPNNHGDRGGGGQYPKEGVYMSLDQTVSVYHSGLLLGDHQATFADMYPEYPGAIPLERVSGPIVSGVYS